MISKEDVIRIYSDAKISLDKNSLDELTEKFSDLIEFNSILLEADLSDVEEMKYNTENKAYLREDTAIEGLDRDTALSYANDREYGYFRLQRVLD